MLYSVVGIDQAGESDEAELIKRAASLINPVSGIANDFLNHFNEILLLVENLPILLPEMVDELLIWTPMTYSEYFARSKLPGRSSALMRYVAMSVEARAYFDAKVENLNAMATVIVAGISNHRRPDGSIPAEEVSEYCEEVSMIFGAELQRLAMFVNCGYDAAIAATEKAA